MSGSNKEGKPELVIFEEICRANILKMMRRAADSGSVLRPHFKTHQSKTVGRWYREEGIKGITVSSVSMAEYFAGDGWDDITIAFPFSASEAEKINELSAKVKLNIIVSTVKSAELASELISARTGVFIEIDTGYPRSGIKGTDRGSIDNCHGIVSKSQFLIFKGFLSHFGHSYSERDIKGITKIWEDGIEILNDLRSSYPGSIISAGDTPCCSIAEDLSGADEIRPGNFVFYDLMQTIIGSCDVKDVAVTVTCHVAAVYKSEKKVVLYCGAVHLSKDSVITGGVQVFGMVGIINENGMPEYFKGCYIRSLSQEHAVVNIPDKYIDMFTEGMKVAVMPVHSCLTIACMKEAYVYPGGFRADIMYGY